MAAYWQAPSQMSGGEARQEILECRAVGLRVLGVGAEVVGPGPERDSRGGAGGGHRLRGADGHDAVGAALRDEQRAGESLERGRDLGPGEGQAVLEWQDPFRRPADDCGQGLAALRGEVVDDGLGRYGREAAQV